LGYGGAAVATALNEAFVPSALRASTPLSDGDRLEIVAPKQGG
jgi:sulfur carrier protein